MIKQLIIVQASKDWWLVGRVVEVKGAGAGFPYSPVRCAVKNYPYFISLL